MVEEILSESSGLYFSDHYCQGALAMSAMQAQSAELYQNDPFEMIQDHVYVVEKGDTLADIAWVYNTGWRMLSMYNCLPDPNVIEPGLEIFIPGSLPLRIFDEPESPVRDAGSPVYEHVIYPGETLEDVASQFGITKEDIMMVNGKDAMIPLHPAVVDDHILHVNRHYHLAISFL